MVGAQPGIRSLRIPAMASSQGDVRSSPMVYIPTQRCGRCRANERTNSPARYLYGQTRALPLSAYTCAARTSPSTILRHRPKRARRNDIHIARCPNELAFGHLPPKYRRASTRPPFACCRPGLSASSSSSAPPRQGPARRSPGAQRSSASPRQQTIQRRSMSCGDPFPSPFGTEMQVTSAWATQRRLGPSLWSLARAGDLPSVLAARAVAC